MGYTNASSSSDPTKFSHPASPVLQLKLFSWRSTVTLSYWKQCIFFLSLQIPQTLSNAWNHWIFLLLWYFIFPLLSQYSFLFLPYLWPILAPSLTVPLIFTRILSFIFFSTSTIFIFVLSLLKAMLITPKYSKIMITTVPTSQTVVGIYNAVQHETSKECELLLFLLFWYH